MSTLQSSDWVSLDVAKYVYIAAKYKSNIWPCKFESPPTKMLNVIKFGHNSAIYS